MNTLIAAQLFNRVRPFKPVVVSRKLEWFDRKAIEQSEAGLEPGRLRPVVSSGAEKINAKERRNRSPEAPVLEGSIGQAQRERS